MILTAPFRDSNSRLPILGAVMAAGLCLLVLALFRLQVVQAAAYGTREQAQSLRRIRIPSARGEIRDRHGVLLANNRPSYDVVLYLDQLRTSKRQDIYRVASSNLAVLAQTMGMPVTLEEHDIRDHYRQRRPLPLTIWRDLPPATVAAFAERAGQLPALDLVATPLRQYPQGALAAHILGFVSARNLTNDDESEEFFYSLPDHVGKKGVERACDEALRGSPGGRTIRVNPSGQTVAAIGFQPAERGDRVTLPLDARIQKTVEDAMEHAPLPAGKELRGAAVALDPRTGEVLAIVSLPTFNPGASSADRATVWQNKAGPLFNRAMEGLYSPGSTFKTVTMLAALESGAVTTGDAVDCKGALPIGNRSFGCWNRRGHGHVDAAAALRLSCDVWFYQKGMATKVENIARMARAFGLGESTGFDLGVETAGLVPDPSWKKQRWHERWWEGDTAQLAIGQSFLLATPMQMACLTAALANGGTVWRPFVVRRVETPAGQLIDETRPEARHRLRLTPSHLEFVRQSMLASVQATDGTGHRAAVRGITVAGKTGTAEVDVRVEGVRQRIKRTWFIGFAPYDAPQVALVVLFEDGESGGHTAAPVAGRIFAGIFQSQLEGGPAERGLYAD